MPAFEVAPRVSPSGRLLAYVSRETGQLEVYVRRLPGPGGRLRVSLDGGTEPIWSRDGRELFYRSTDRMMSVVISEQPELTVVRRDVLFEDVYARNADHQNYDVFSGGREFLMLGEERTEARFMIVINWFAELQARMGNRRE
jgi:eukaryotic-like serine/threonine-protein kinase